MHRRGLGRTGRLPGNHPFFVLLATVNAPAWSDFDSRDRPAYQTRPATLPPAPAPSQAAGSRPFPLEPAPIHLPDEVLADLRRRLELTRWPEDAGNQDWH
jgi:hypothetical protein